MLLPGGLAYFRAGFLGVAFAMAFGVGVVDAAADEFAAALTAAFGTAFGSAFSTGFNTGFSAGFDAVFGEAFDSFAGSAFVPEVASDLIADCVYASRATADFSFATALG